MKKLHTLGLKVLLILLSSFLVSNSYADELEIYDTVAKKHITTKELSALSAGDDIHIFGEFHNNQSIQNAQANLLESLVINLKNQADFIVNWEFLNYEDAPKIQKHMLEFFKGQHTGLEIVSLLAGKQNISYAPIFNVIKKLEGEVRGINIPRSIKQKIIKQGIDSVSSTYIPVSHYIGGPEYRERFKLAMGGHVTGELLNKYFEVQCLTDSVMAFEVAKNQYKQAQFVIAGSFHTDFFDATVTRLQKLSPKKIWTYKFVSKSSHTTQEIEQFKQGHSTYGAYADYLVISK